MALVLIVEDDVEIRESIAELLAAEGYAVAQAGNGLEALRRARERRPNAIVLDLMMPVMTGWEFRAAQKQDHALADVPVIIISAVPPAQLSAVDDVQERIEKPFAIHTLLQAVRRQAPVA